MEANKNKVIKCKRTGCSNIPAQGRWYCSKECAPQVHLTGGDNTKSENMTSKSSTRVPGAQSEMSWEDVRKKGKEILKETKMKYTGPLLMKENENNTGLTQKDQDYLNEINGEIKDQSGEKEVMNAELETPLKETLPAYSVSPSVILSPVESQVMNSIDACVSQLTNLMQSAENNLKACEKPSPYMPSMINAVANSAREIQKLLKLKLEIVRDKIK